MDLVDFLAPETLPGVAREARRADSGYSPEQYQREKRDGTRLPSGAMRIKRLKGRHLRIITLHMSGKSNKDIALELHCSETWVAVILSHPLSLEYKKRLLTRQENEFDALFGKSVGVLRESLDNNDPALRLRAVDLIFRGQGRFKGNEDKSKLTAEDIVGKMLEMAQATGQVQEVSIKVG